MRIYVAAIVVTQSLFLFGCATAERDRSGNLSSSTEMKLGDARLVERKFDDARIHYNRVLTQALAVDRDGYLAQQLYREKAAVKSRLAFLELHLGDVEAAGGQYRNTIELLRKDIQAHRSALELEKNKQNVGDQVKKGLVSKLASLGLSKIEEELSSEVLSEIGVFSVAGSLVSDILNTPPPENQIVDAVGGELNGELRSLRIPVIPDTDYFQYIGRIVAGESSCTGSLVGPGLVLTNAHCIFDGGVDYNKGPTSLKSGEFKFRREWLHSTDQFSVKTFYTHKGLEGDWDGQIKNDWVILKLFDGDGSKSRRVPDGYFDVAGDLNVIANHNPSSRVFVPGYSSDFSVGTYLTLDAGCGIDPTGLDEAIVQHNCHSFSGSSGAPVLYLDANARPTLIAVNVGKIGGTSEYKGIMVPPARWFKTLIGLLE